MERSCREHGVPGRTAGQASGSTFAGLAVVFRLLCVRLGLSTDTFQRPGTACHSHPVVHPVGAASVEEILCVSSVSQSRQSVFPRLFSALSSPTRAWSHAGQDRGVDDDRYGQLSDRSAHWGPGLHTSSSTISGSSFSPDMRTRSDGDRQLKHRGPALPGLMLQHTAARLDRGRVRVPEYHCRIARDDGIDGSSARTCRSKRRSPPASTTLVSGSVRAQLCVSTFPRTAWVSGRWRSAVR